MRTVEEIKKDIEGCFMNLQHLVKINPKWKTELSDIDPNARPVGYSNQLEALRQQETAFNSENTRLLVLKAEEWVALLGPLSEEDLETLKNALKNAASVVSKEIKTIQDAKLKSDSSLF